MQVIIGTAPDSWGVWFRSDAKQIPWTRFLDEVQQAGYQWIEIGAIGYLPTDPATLKKELDKRNLNVSGPFVIGHLEDADGWNATQEQADRVGKLVKAMGGKFMVLNDDTYSDLFTGNRTGARTTAGDEWTAADCSGRDV